MSAQITLEYLSKLLNKPVTEQMEIALSSAQKSRVHGWLIKNGITFNEAALAKKFTINQLLSDLGSSKIQHQSRTQETFSSPIKLSMGNFQIGVDIQRVDELFPRGLSSDPKVDQELTQIFTTKELSYAQSKGDPEITLAGIFSAKEAIQKACNANKILNKIEILPDENGRPKSKGYALSISHSGNYAIAIAINESQAQEKLFETDEATSSKLDPDIPLKQNVNRAFESIRAVDIFFIVLFLIIFSSFYKSYF